MTFVEHRIERDYPSFLWGNDIAVNVLPSELEVTAVVPILTEDQETFHDPFLSYRQAIGRFGAEKRQGKNSPHIQFANADNDQKLITFVRRFGPVVASSCRTEERAVHPEDPLDFRTSKTVLIASQDLVELKNERLAFRAALALVSELQRGEELQIPTIRACITEIVDKVSDWPRQWERERRLRETGPGSPQPHWSFTQERLRHLQMFMYSAGREPSGDRLTDVLSGLNPVYDGHLVICEIVNAFTPLVYPWGTVPVEAPHWDLTGGIRPVLYHILRREYLQAGGVAVCRNIECREVFEIERSGQEFCSEQCSRHQRQREYWQRRGKKLRKRKRKAHKSALSKQSRDPHKKKG